MMGFGVSPNCQAPRCDEWLKGRQTRFCSDLCRVRAYRAEKRTLPAEKTCVLCGAGFRPLRGRQTYCDFEEQASERCASMQSDVERRKREAEDARYEAECEHCGDHTGWDGVGRSRRFCSPRCKTAYYRAEKRNA